MAKKSIEINIDEKILRDAQKIYEKLGFTVYDAVRIFLNQSVLCRGLPFELKLPEENEKTENVENTESSEISKRVASNEELVRQMRLEFERVNSEIEADLNSRKEIAVEEKVAETKTEPVSEPQPETKAELPSESHSEPELETEAQPAAEEKVEVKTEAQPVVQTEPEVKEEPKEEKVSEEKVPEKENKKTSIVDDEEENTDTPTNLFDSWNIGAEEEIGCGN